MSTLATPRPGRRTATLALLVATILGVLLAGAGPASAHAKVTATDPAEDAVLKTAPRQITMNFTEPMTLSEDSIKVFDPQGQRVDTGTTAHVGSDRATARVALESGLADGTYTVSWQAVSADSHPIGEAFVFSVGKPSPTKAVGTGTRPGGGVVGTLYSVTRFIAYLGYVLAVGAGAFLLVCWPDGARLRRVRRLLQAGWSALLLSTPALLLLRAPYTSGEGIGRALDLGALRATLDTDAGTALLVRLLLLGGTGLFLAVVVGAGSRPTADTMDGEEAADPVPRPTVLRPALIVSGLFIAAVLAGTWARTGHAAAGLQTALALPADALHLMAVAVWLGGLVTLVTVLFRTRAGERVPPQAVARFSRLAFAAVAVLAATGLYQSWRLVGSFEALFATRYGVMLLLKTAAVAGVLAAAAGSRRFTARLREPARHEDRTTAAALAQPTVHQPLATAVAVTGTSAPGTRSGQTGESAFLVGTQPGDPDAPEPGTGAGDSGPASRLRRSVAVEAALALVVLGVTTVLTDTTPGRTEAAAPELAAATAVAQPTAVSVTVPFDTGARYGSGKVLVDLSPASVGRNELQALVYAFDNGITSVPELRITFTHPERGIGPLDAHLKDVGGYWAAGNLQFPTAGKWQMSVTVRISDVDQATASTTITVR
ncbi:copper resistance CopC/CopD family protein [Streptomyces sp. CA-142005]|uniref:copper resistance CopC/CopD family protein n=1 Tax=Streptomyces sp. CA-142005 TaxID=3240052 RepID=UPI003D8A69F6